ncbi:MAG: protein kinase, partial [Candidatus Eisenbacteria bacterium]|nr:protein kinase [Candidatus Latescibacterota bacterium]MBD3302084.1 protein kinase [Candidatus Eisenbacteria bacterium]
MDRAGGSVGGGSGDPSMTTPAVRLAPGLPGSLEPVETIHRASGRSVWRLRDVRSGRRQVFKCVEPDADPSQRRGIVDEFLLLERLRHPHWVRPLGFHHLEDGTLGYRMEELAPFDTAEEGWRPRDPEAVRQVLGALRLLHAVGFCHLDLKPGQILRGRDGVCLVDPGLAAPVGSTVEPRGTWGYIAPELLDRRPWDERADLYAFGCVLVEVWTGTNLLGEGEVADQIRRQRSVPDLRLRERVEEMPEGLDRAVERLLHPDPDRRPRDANRAWEELHSLAGYRDGYFERSRLPVPLDLPFFPSAGLEEDWRAALRGTGPRRWVLTGAAGSGRRRLRDRLAAVAETIGGTVRRRAP